MPGLWLRVHLGRTQDRSKEKTMNSYTLLWWLLWQSLYFGMFLYFFLGDALGVEKRY